MPADSHRFGPSGLRIWDYCGKVSRLASAISQSVILQSHLAIVKLYIIAIYIQFKITPFRATTSVFVAAAFGSCYKKRQIIYDVDRDSRHSVRPRPMTLVWYPESGVTDYAIIILCYCCEFPAKYNGTHHVAY